MLLFRYHISHNLRMPQFSSTSVFPLLFLISCGYLALLASAGSPEPQGLYTNPIFDGSSPDPYIYLHDDGFYYFVVRIGTGITVMKNDRLTNWRDPLQSMVVYETPEGYANLWAPEIHFFDGYFHIYFTMGTGPIPTQRMWVIKALERDTPFTNYTEKIR